ncbi:ATP-binding protein [Brevundimonas sp. NPDC092305]|uniref:hybrid sensor histidine kinase/response regulator n=1 Tax=Brevundimonas sp. NPDC092305 TaxID=3363957 RepID=UPI003826404A
MSLLRFVLTGLAALVMLIAAPVSAAPPVHNPAAAAPSSAEAVQLARFVEQRAAATSFADLRAFGEAAMVRKDREGLNRLYHVTWTVLNQGDFADSAIWNQRLAEGAARQGDKRYADIARLNTLTIRYDQGEVAVARDMRTYLGDDHDWFVRAHAARLVALSLMDQGRVGEGLQMLTRAQADIPAVDPYAATARAGIWEVVGMGLKDLDDIEGATAAFRKFEIDYSNPAYPRPDFDSLYNLTKMSVRVGDLEHAQAFWTAHHRSARRSDLPSLKVYDSSLCAMVADARSMPGAVLACLAPFGEDFGDAAFLAMDILPLRAIARAQTGDLAGARRDLTAYRALAGNVGQASDVAHVEAEILFAEGRASEAYRLLRSHMREEQIADARGFSSGIHQVTGDMQQQLDQRRAQLETARANTRLQGAIMGIGVIFLLCAGSVVWWQMRQGRRLKLAQRKAEEANRAKSEFLANMSHEIRTPLNGVVSMADALARRDLAPQEHEMIELIRSSSATLERLLSDILDSAKIEAGQVSLEPTVFVLRQAVNDIGALWRARADDKGVDLVVDMDAALDGAVEGDAIRLRQVLANLISNALKFTSKGSVSLIVRAVGDDRVRFEVRDTGVGFDEDQRKRIFQRFQQADGSITRRYGGTGLGLAISQALVTLMGGELDCESAPGTGSVFFFDIPLPRTDAAVAEIESADVAEVEDRPLRILLADDHPANRKVVEIMLGATDMELEAVEDGLQALNAFRGGGYDVVLMDMQMPVMDGLTATHSIRAHEAEHDLARTPIIMLTANALTEHVEQGRAAGADGHLSKPITLATLMAAIGRVLSADTDLEAA